MSEDTIINFWKEWDNEVDKSKVLKTLPIVQQYIKLIKEKYKDDKELCDALEHSFLIFFNSYFEDLQEYMYWKLKKND